MEVDETAGKNPFHGEKIPMYNLGPSKPFMACVGPAVEATATGADRNNCRIVKSDAVSMWRNGYFFDICLSIFDRPMDSPDHNKLKNDQEQLEWVEPQISLMVVQRTFSKLFPEPVERYQRNRWYGNGSHFIGPS